MSKKVDAKCPKCGSFLNLSLVVVAKTVALAGVQVKFEIVQIPQLWCDGVVCAPVEIDGDDEWQVICDFEVDGYIDEDGKGCFKASDLE